MNGNGKHQKCSVRIASGLSTGYRGGGVVRCPDCKRSFEGPRAERLAMKHRRLCHD